MIRAAVRRRVHTYPLQRPLLYVGTLLGACVALAAQSLLVGFAVFTVAALAAMLWRRNEPPILVFCLGYQWLFVTAGYTYQRISGEYPGFVSLGDVYGAVLLSLVGLITLAMGIRGALHLSEQFKDSNPVDTPYDVVRSFWLVIAIYSVNWTIELAPKQIWYDGSQVLSSVLAFRTVFLGILLFEVLRQRRGYRLAGLAMLFVMVPETLSGQSRFSGALFLAIVAVLTQWRPWASGDWRTLRLGVGLGSVLIVLALGWQGAVKAPWRVALTSQEAMGSPFERIKAFGGYAATALTDFDVSNGVVSLIERTGAATAFFSHVIDRVPAQIPYQNGELIGRAIEHVFLPRVFFPDKRDLGSDSWLIWVFAGMAAAGEEAGASIGLGYIAQFYIDFGVPWMFFGLFVFGLVIGGCYRLLMLSAGSATLFGSVVCVVFLNNFMSYDGEIAKTLGGLLTSVGISAVIVRLTRRRIGCYLQGRKGRRRHDWAAAAVVSAGESV